MADRKPFLLRTDARTLDLLKSWADDEFRSLNSQIEYILKRALKEAGRLKGPDTKPPAKGDNASPQIDEEINNESV